MNWETTLKKISDQTALSAAALWVKKPINLQLINNQINCVYRFEEKGQGYYLRMTHEQVRTMDELEAALDFQKHLFLNKAPVCPVVPSRNNLLIETVNQGDLSFSTHVCLEVPGSVMHFEHKEQKTYHVWGRALALLHQAARTYEPKISVFLSWKDLWKETRDYAAQDSQETQSLCEQITAWFDNYKETPLNFGLIHGDHRPGNVLYDGHQIRIIDFDEPVYHWFVADITMPFLDLCQKPYSTWRTLWDWYIEGYNSISPLSDDILQTLNWFTQMKSLGIYLWCKNNWFEATAPGGKPREQWLNELFHMAMTPLFKG